MLSRKQAYLPPKSQIFPRSPKAASCLFLAEGLHESRATHVFVPRLNTARTQMEITGHHAILVPQRKPNGELKNHRGLNHGSTKGLTQLL